MREKLPFSLFPLVLNSWYHAHTHTPLTLYNLEKIKLKRNVPWFHLYVHTENDVLKYCGDTKKQIYHTMR